jgi:hypothetical protein
MEEARLSDEGRHDERESPGAESGIIVFGGGGRGCSGIGCLGWILISVVLSVVLTVLANLLLYLLSGPAVGIRCVAASSRQLGEADE